MIVKATTIRIDTQTLQKLRFIAQSEARSANGQILVLIRECIEKYEEKHGEIVLGNEKKNTGA